jgi:hypothetical protein
MQVMNISCSMCGGSSCGCSSITHLQSSAINRAESVRKPELKLGAQVSPLENGAAAFTLTDRIELSFEGLNRLHDEGTKSSPDKLDEDEKRQLEALKQRDREVRAHEQAHLAAAGSYAAGGASYTYEKGPDGVLYAVGGEVPIDVSEVQGDPQATLLKAATIMRAALAPADPSSADRAIAAKAAAMAAKAQQDAAKESSEKQAERIENSKPAVPENGEAGKPDRSRESEIAGFVSFGLSNAVASYRQPSTLPTRFEAIA